MIAKEWCCPFVGWAIEPPPSFAASLFATAGANGWRPSSSQYPH